MVIIFEGRPCIYELTGNDSYRYKKEYKNKLKKYCNYKKDFVLDYTPTLVDINYLEHYGGHIYKLPYTGTAISQASIYNTLNKNKFMESEVENTIINRCILKNTTYKKNKMSCSSFIICILNDLGIIQYDINKDCYLPKDVENICIKSGKYDCSNMVFTHNGYLLL
jgi:hypothetical protein